MKILVTGTAGFIGYHLAKKLLERGDEVVGLDNINDYYDVNLKYARLKELGIGKDELKDNELVSSKTYPNHKFIKANLEDSQTINKLFETVKFDAVCNLAAQAGVRYSIENPHAYIQSNVVGFMNILEACRNYDVKNLSYASSSSVYGLNKSQPFKTSDHTDHPVSLYAATRKSNEMMAHTYSHLYNISCCGLRFFTCYGEMDDQIWLLCFLLMLYSTTDLSKYLNGNMSRDFTYVGDIVDGIIKVIDNPAKPSDKFTKESKAFDANNPDPSISSAPYRIYNIGNNSLVQLLDFIKTLEKAIGKEATKSFMDMQDGDVVSTYADVSDLINDFGYKPDTSLEVGIERFVKWYKEFYIDKNKI